MTVNDLIESLKAYNGDKEVIVAMYNGDDEEATVLKELSIIGASPTELEFNSKFVIDVIVKASDIIDMAKAYNEND